MDAATTDRSSWPIRRVRLSDDRPRDDDNSPTERVAMMWPLSLEAWVVAGRAVPDYSRDEVPARLLRPAS